MADDRARRAELATNLAAVRARLDRACTAAGRDPQAVTLVAVTKTFPVTDVRLLAGLGVTDIGENRDQEAAGKHAGCADLALRWHFVGQLQRNKCRSVARYADVVHSLDRTPIVRALSDALTGIGREITALVQVSLDVDADARGGVSPTAAVDLAGQVDAATGLVLGGVMAVAPNGAAAEPAFARLGEVAAAVQAAYPAAVVVSAGMSGDLEAAVRHGATHVRIGTALLGGRVAPVG